MNIIPLIPQHGMADKRDPTCAELNAAREAAAPFLDGFRHAGAAAPTRRAS
jgi:nitrogen fixation protein NifB